MIEKFLQVGLVPSTPLDDGSQNVFEQKEYQKLLRLLKTLYGMADEMDSADFFLQNKENTNIVFVRDDLNNTLAGLQEDETDCMIRFKLL